MRLLGLILFLSVQALGVDCVNDIVAARENVECKSCANIQLRVEEIMSEPLGEEEYLVDPYGAAYFLGILKEFEECER